VALYPVITPPSGERGPSTYGRGRGRIPEIDELADFETAFDHARVLIHRWEMRDGAVPSNPQARFGRGLVGKLARFFATNPGQ
jgi:hypothetical protein